MHLTEFLKENPKFADKGLYLIKVNKGDVFLTNDSKKGMKISFRKVNKKTKALSDKNLILYMLKYSTEYLYQYNKNDKILVLYPIKKRGNNEKETN